jgi:hypothetical protein
MDHNNDIHYRPNNHEYSMGHDDVICYDSGGHGYSIDHSNIYADCGHRHRVFLLVLHRDKSHDRLQDANIQHNKDNEPPDHLDKDFDCICDHSDDTSDLYRNTIHYAD